MMKRGKNILTQILILTAMLMLCSPALLCAQGGGGGGGGGMSGGMSRSGGGGMDGGGPGGESEDEPEMTAKNLLSSTGLFLIEFDEVVKKVGVKSKDTEKRAAVQTICDAYKAEYDKIMETYSVQIDSIFKDDTTKDRDEQKESEQMQQGNSRGGQRGQNPMDAKITFVQRLTAIAKPMHNKIKSSMAATLTEKELAKWDKYYSKLCEKKLLGQFTKTSSKSSRGGMR